MYVLVAYSVIYLAFHTLPRSSSKSAAGPGVSTTHVTPEVSVFVFSTVSTSTCTGILCAERSASTAARLAPSAKADSSSRLSTTSMPRVSSPVLLQTYQIAAIIILSLTNLSTSNRRLIDFHPGASAIRSSPSGTGGFWIAHLALM